MIGFGEHMQAAIIRIENTSYEKIGRGGARSRTEIFSVRELAAVGFGSARKLPLPDTRCFGKQI